MQHVKLASYQCVDLIAKVAATPEQAIKEAIQISRENRLIECNLFYKGFTFGICHDSNVDELVSEYNEWIKFNKNKQT